MTLLSKSFVVVTALLAGCAGAPGLQLPVISVGFPVEKTESPIQAEPVTIVLPKTGIDSYADSEREPLLFGAVRFPVRQGQIDTGGTTRDWWSERTVASANGEQIVTSMCRIKAYSPTGTRYESCVRIDALVVVAETADARIVTLAPFRRRVEIGRDLIGIAVSPPEDAGIQRWYALIAAQSVEADFRFVSKYRVESLRGNFDRNLQPIADRAWRGKGAPGAYARSYRMDLASGARAIVDAAFYPYQDGSVVEIRVQASTPMDAASRLRDWKALLDGVKGRLERIAAE